MTDFESMKGRVAVVTGGMRGIGRAISDLLAKHGTDVHIFDVEEDLHSKEVPHTCHVVDVSDPKSVETAVQSLPDGATLLVNNAGITRDHSIAKMSDTEWQSVISVNLTGPFNMIRALAPTMRAANYGRIVNITSINGMRGKFGQANYSAAKAGLIGLTKTTARELGPKGITVNAVAPGMVLTDMVLTVAEEFRQRAREEAVLNQLAEPTDIANVVLFLLSDAARLITGEVIKVDGGQYI